jgi:hypothetical protein
MRILERIFCVEPLLEATQASLDSNIGVDLLRGNTTESYVSGTRIKYSSTGRENKNERSRVSPETQKHTATIDHDGPHFIAFLTYLASSALLNNNQTLQIAQAIMV